MADIALAERQKYAMSDQPQTPNSPAGATGRESASPTGSDAEQPENPPCWCGVENPYYADSKDGLDATCGGSGVLNCYCGGDLCVCHWHGEVECFGCPGCEPEDDECYDD